MLEIVADLAVSCLKAVLASVAIMGTFWLLGLTEVWGTIGVAGMLIILLGIFWAIFFDTRIRSGRRVAAFCLTYIAVSQALYLLFEPWGLVREDLRFVLEGVALFFASCLLFSSNGAEDRAAA